MLSNGGIHQHVRHYPRSVVVVVVMFGDLLGDMLNQKRWRAPDAEMSIGLGGVRRGGTERGDGTRRSSHFSGKLEYNALPIVPQLISRHGDSILRSFSRSRKFQAASPRSICESVRAFVRALRHTINNSRKMLSVSSVPTIRTHVSNYIPAYPTYSPCYI